MSPATIIYGNMPSKRCVERAVFVWAEIAHELLILVWFLYDFLVMLSVNTSGQRWRDADGKLQEHLELSLWEAGVQTGKN